MTSTSSLVSICEIDDVFHGHLLPLLTAQEAGRLEGTCRSLRNVVDWEILCARDFTATRRAPVYSEERLGFDTLEETETWKKSYQKWSTWHKWTHGAATAPHLVEAVELWARLKAVLRAKDLHNILHSLSPCLEEEAFQELAGKIPSSLAA